ncbi:MAG: restriction endonuclease, partial [Calditrichaeota bacterium]
MDFIDKIQSLAQKISKQLEYITTEEATKSALIMPFINALGYNVFDPTEVVPEFTADVGIKKGEKVDYAIMRDGEPIMLMECKWSGSNLDEVHASQLFRYFSVTASRIGVLTNGIIYRFYSDLEQSNKMDDKPFLEIDMLNLSDSLVQELKKITKSNFNLEDVISTASDLKYTKEIKKILGDQLLAPDEDFVRYFASQVYTGKLTQVVREQFTDIVKRALSQFISEKINERLKSAMAQDNEEEKNSEKEDDEEEINTEKKESRVVTTDDELEGYHIVKSILRKEIDPDRIIHRDTMSYFGILLDDNNRKPICRLYFNSNNKKQIAFMNEDKKETKVELTNLNQIYDYTDQLRSIVKF